MDAADKRREYARRYRERNRELLAAKERERHARKPKTPKPRPTLEERFWAKVAKTGPDDCWEWTGGKDHGYGSIGRGYGSVRANRLSWELHNGAIPEGRHVLHTCDNRGCVNPAHLYIGTDVENARDRVERGRAKGPRGPVKREPGWNRKTRDDDRRGYANAKLTVEQVREIRARKAPGVSNKVLGEEFGVTGVTIGDVLRRKGRYAGIE